MQVSFNIGKKYTYKHTTNEYHLAKEKHIESKRKSVMFYAIRTYIVFLLIFCVIFILDSVFSKCVHLQCKGKLIGVACRLWKKTTTEEHDNFFRSVFIFKNGFSKTKHNSLHSSTLNAYLHYKSQRHSAFSEGIKDEKGISNKQESENARDREKKGSNIQISNETKLKKKNSENEWSKIKNYIYLRHT